ELVGRLTAGAAEAGAAWVVRLQATPLRPVTSRDLVREALSPTGAAVQLHRVAATWSIDEPALAELVDPTHPVVRLTTPDRVHTAVARVLGQLAGGRVLVIAVAGVEHAPELLELVIDGLSAFPERTVVILTASGAATPTTAPLLAKLPPPVSVPVTPESWRAATDRRLGLATPTERVAAMEPSARALLAVAEVAGEVVELDLWSEVCARLGLGDPADQLPDLITGGWLEPDTRRRYLFASAESRAALRAAGAVSEREVREALVQVLAERPPTHARAEHLLALGRRLEGARAWFEAGRARTDADARRFMDELERRVATDPPDRVTVLVWWLRAMRARLGRDSGEEGLQLERVERWVDATGDEVMRSLLAYANARRHRNDLEACRRIVAQGRLVDLPDDLGRYWFKSSLLSMHADLCQFDGQMEEGLAVARRAREVALAEEDRSHVHQATVLLAAACIETERHEEARSWLDVCAGWSGEMDPMTLGSYLQVDAMLAEVSGELVRAEWANREAIEVRDRLGFTSPEGRVNHALILAQLGRLDEARARLDEAGVRPRDRRDADAAWMLLAATEGDLPLVRELLSGLDECPSGIYRRAADLLRDVDPALADECLALAT
ncbi:MAG: hypothetical protein KC621_22725, partial [Myxococcales bacterium]|nr:hypothetical protein [Myxococcales bacterium]